MPTNEELMKAVADVLDEALAEYDALVKSGQGIDYAQVVDDHKGDGPKAKSVDGSTGEGTGAADNAGAGAMTKEEMPQDVKDKDKDDKDEDEDEEKLMQAYKSLVAKMDKKGMKHKMMKSESAPAPEAKEVESLKKSVDDRFESLTKAMEEVRDAVKKISAQPATSSRKGVAGYQPLRKTEEAGATSLKKSEVINKLLELKKTGNSEVDSSLINRVETNRLSPKDAERIKGLLA